MENFVSKCHQNLQNRGFESRRNLGQLQIDKIFYQSILPDSAISDIMCKGFYKKFWKCISEIFEASIFDSNSQSAEHSVAFWCLYPADVSFKNNVDFDQS